VTSADVGTCGADDAAQSIDVVHGQELLGSIRVWLPGGAGLRPGDVRLLEALADQAAVVFRNVALEALLEVHVADLDRTTHDLARSRVRIIEADDRARRTMEAAISRDVLPHLSAVSAGIRRARVANDTGLDTGLDDLVARTNTALESLRELTRGLFPTQLARAGIDPALRSLLARRGLAGALRVDRSCAGRRFSPGAEAAVYSCCVAAVRELLQVTSLELSLVTGELVLVVRGTRRAAGDEVQGILDRAEAVGGSVTATRGGLVVRIPVDEGMPASAGGVVPDL
jgi:signal transduction histidine kinase